MRIALTPITAELDIETDTKAGEKTYHLILPSGTSIKLSRSDAVSLLFGREDKLGGTKIPPLLPPGKITATTATIAATKSTPAKPRKRGCQSPASREKLSKALKRFYAKKRKAAGLAPTANLKRHGVNGINTNKVASRPN